MTRHHREIVWCIAGAVNGIAWGLLGHAVEGPAGLVAGFVIGACGMLGLWAIVSPPHR